MRIDTEPLLEALVDPWLHATIDRFYGRDGLKTAEIYDRLCASLRVEELLLPVVGVQGAGKTTLLSGLLFDRPVLPTDVDETTSVPTEIRFGERLEAEVEFQDGRVEPIAPTEEALARLVHNEHNPGNRLGIKCLRVRVADDLLRDGLVLVDLPGLGSLTPENRATTEDYARSCVAVLVLVRTTPPLTRHESLIVGSIWPLVPELMFAQNRWTDESDKQAAEGREYNRYKLGELAERVRVAVGKEGPDVTVVCAWRGQAARFRGEPIPPDLAGLRETLSSLASSWRARLRGSVDTQVQADIAATLRSARQERESLAKDEEQLLAEKVELRARFERFRRDLGKRRNEGLDKVEAASAELSEHAATWCRVTKQKLRNEMRTKIRGGIVDGGRLDEAFAHEQRDHVTELVDHSQERVAELRDELYETFGGMEDWDFARQVPTQAASLEERRKWESHLPEVGGAAGGIGAAAAFGAMGGGAKLGAALGITGGPAGVAVGAVAGAVVGIAGFFLAKALGAGVKKLKAKGRQSRAEAAIFPLIAAFADDTRTGLEKQLEEMEETFRASLDAWLKREKKRFREQEVKQDERLTLDAQAKAARVREVQETLDRLDALASRLRGGNGD